MADFNIGDCATVLDEALSGKVTRIEGDMVTITTAEGFLLRYRTKDLVKVEGDITVSPVEAAQAKKEKARSQKQSSTVQRPKPQHPSILEVDLHSHRLVTSTKGLRAFDILNLQLKTAKQRLDFAIEKRIPKVVFIHGVGTGVLKSELYYLLTKYDNLKVYDADYQKYGLGATEVYIFQNP